MKFHKYFLFAALGMALIGCKKEFLNPLPDTAVVTETFYDSDEALEQGLIGIYDAIQGVNENTNTNIQRSNRGVQFEYLLTEHRSDNTQSATLEGSKADFHRYLVNPNNAQSEDYYQSMYEVIFRANNVLDFMDIANDANQLSYTAEASFLRAYAYFNLVRLFGEVPLVTTVVGPEDEEAIFTRRPTSEVYDQIVLDLEVAIVGLDNTYKSRASQAAAQALLAKVYLTREARDYGAAASLCQDIINSGEFTLQANFRDVFYNELNSEIIFAIEYQDGNAEESQGFSAEFTSTVRQGRDDGLNMVNTNLVDDFAQYGGFRDSLSYVTFGTKNEVIKFLPIGSDVSVSPPTYGANARLAGNDWIVLRYADVLLMHAEALMAGGTETANSSAIDSYMEVKVRAGFDAVTDRPAILSKDALLAERRVELAFENHRFFDLVRFGEADAVLSAHALVMGYGSYNSRMLLLPIPAREINLSRGTMTQNPGY